MDERVRRLLDEVHEAICLNGDEFEVAKGRAVITVFIDGDRARVELTSSKTLAGVGERRSVISRPRLSGEVRVLADDVRRAMRSDSALVSVAREVEIEIFLRGPRPTFDISYRRRRT